MPLSPVERKAEFAKASVLRGHRSLTDACAKLSVTWVHLRDCMAGARVPSIELAERVAEFVGMPVEKFWGSHIGGNREPAVAR